MWTIWTVSTRRLANMAPINAANTLKASTCVNKSLTLGFPRLWTGVCATKETCFTFGKGLSGKQIFHCKSANFWPKNVGQKWNMFHPFGPLPPMLANCSFAKHVFQTPPNQICQPNPSRFKIYHRCTIFICLGIIISLRWYILLFLSNKTCRRTFRYDISWWPSVYMPSTWSICWVKYICHKYEIEQIEN